MHFHSLDYVLFLVCVVCGFWLLANRGVLRLAFVFLASCLFYMAWNPTYIVLILSSTVLDYTVGGRIHASTTITRKRGWLLLSLIGNLGLLGVFKYFNFFASASADVARVFGFAFEPPHLDVLLPVGISFYTFQTLSYTIDIYRGRLKPAPGFLQFAFFVTFFPQLVAGPIVRASELLPQLQGRLGLSPGSVGNALFLIATGMVKKVLFADYVAVNLVDRVFEDPGAYSSAEVLIGLYGYTLQIYCDFSGYTDVARGSASLFGLDLPENFDRPYQARNPAEFWRHWHMTLSSWLRDYLYFPLGGSRGSPARAYFNLGLTMFLIGLWHGAAWTFVIYGLLQAGIMLAHRFVQRRYGKGRGHVDPPLVVFAKVFGTMQFVVLSRIFFRAADLDNALAVIQQLRIGSLGVGHVSGSVWAVLIGGFAAHYTPRGWFEHIRSSFVRLPAPAQGVVLAVVGAGLMTVVSKDVVPYIYFQF
ncbi:MAG: MBOAT family protein [Myxococcales bacterium]|nr:MBOAT family protein [Myxococcales bacterium]